MKNIFSIITGTILALVFSTTVVDAQELPTWVAALMTGGSFLVGFVAPRGTLFTIINPADLTFNGEEIRSLSEAIFERVFDKPALSDMHTIITGIEAKKQIALFGLLGLMGKTGAKCDPDESTETIPLSEKFWDPCDISDRLVQCWDDLKESFFVFGQKKGVKRPDLDGTDFVNFVTERLGDAIKEAQLRFSHFGDVDAALSTASPAGNLGPDEDVDFWNCFDGFWKQIFDITTTTPARRHIIVENAEALEVDQLDLADDRALLVLRNLKQKADKRLKASKDKMFTITDTLRDNLETFLESQNVNSSFERIEAGHGDMLFYNKIPIVTFDFWDRQIDAHFNNGIKLHLPHRAILGEKSNMQIGVENTAAIDEVDSFYNKRTKKYFMDFQFKMDAKVVEDYLIQAAF